MVTLREEDARDWAFREALLDCAFGKSRKRKTSQRLRDGRLPAEGLAFSAVDENGQLIGTLRLWDVTAGSAGPALLLGPLAVAESHRCKGLGTKLMQHALETAKTMGHRAVLLVGDEPYYGRFGFSRSVAEGLQLPGPVERQRFLGLELEAGSLAGAEGLIRPSGRKAQRNRIAA